MRLGCPVLSVRLGPGSVRMSNQLWLISVSRHFSRKAYGRQRREGRLIPRHHLTADRGFFGAERLIHGHSPNKKAAPERGRCRAIARLARVCWSSVGPNRNGPVLQRDRWGCCVGYCGGDHCLDCEGGSSPFPSFFAHDDLPKLAGIAEH
jgi:hypothetical protein